MNNNEYYNSQTFLQEVEEELFYEVRNVIRNLQSYANDDHTEEYEYEPNCDAHILNMDLQYKFQQLVNQNIKDVAKEMVQMDRKTLKRIVSYHYNSISEDDHKNFLEIARKCISNDELEKNLNLYFQKAKIANANIDMTPVDIIQKCIISNENKKLGGFKLRHICPTAWNMQNLLSKKTF
ncbi:MAG: hypothetical protein IJ848_03880 [Alphaproteobacteria bacterium]|nr:hypothetical protein [Alphaproteobacteria bacterium]